MEPGLSNEACCVETLELIWDLISVSNLWWEAGDMRPEPPEPPRRAAGEEGCARRTESRCAALMATLSSGVLMSW